MIREDRERCETFLMDASVGAKWATPEIFELSPIKPIAFFRLRDGGDPGGSSRTYLARDRQLPLGRPPNRYPQSVLAQRALEALLNRDFPNRRAALFLPERFKIACDF